MPNDLFAGTLAGAAGRHAPFRPEAPDTMIAPAIAAAGCGCDARDMLHGLVSIDAALARIAAHAAPVTGTKTVALEAALGHVLARPLRARAMVPAFDNAAMDGYAVASSALAGEGPWRLRVVARVPAGQRGADLPPGATAARIFTGAPVPEGADAVVMQEAVTRDGDVILLRRRPRRG